MNNGLITSSVSLAPEAEFIIADHVSSTFLFLPRSERASSIRRCTSSTPSWRAIVTAFQVALGCSSPPCTVRDGGGGSRDVAKAWFMPILFRRRLRR